MELFTHDFLSVFHIYFLCSNKCSSIKNKSNLQIITQSCGFTKAKLSLKEFEWYELH